MGKRLMVVGVLVALVGCAHPTLPPGDASQCGSWAREVAWAEGILLHYRHVDE